MTSSACLKTLPLPLSSGQVLANPFLALQELVGWITEKRWFMEKEAKITGVDRADAVVLAPGPDPVVSAQIVAFRLGNKVGHHKLYFLPVILSSTGVSDVSPEDTVCLELTDGTLYLALAEHSKLYQEPWFRCLAEQITLNTERGGRIRFRAFSSLSQSLTGGLQARPLGLEISTSNSLTLVESGAVKWVSKTYKDLRGSSGEAGRKWPENYEALRYEALAGAGYPNIPRLHGLVVYEDPDGTVSALGAVMEVVDKEDEVGKLFGIALERYVNAWTDRRTTDETFHSRHRQGAAAAAREIAVTIARMHAGFLADVRESFRPVSTSDQERLSLSQTPLRDLEGALRNLCERQQSEPDHALAVLIQKLQRTEGDLKHAADAFLERSQGLMKAQIHGDLHTGQGLIAAGPGGHVIDRFLREIEGGNADSIQSVARELARRVRWHDFEGVPAKIPTDDAEDGRASQLADLAGIVQAFWYIVNLYLYTHLGLPEAKDWEEWLKTPRVDRGKARRISLTLAREMTPEEAAVPGLTAELIKLLNDWLAEVTSAFIDGYLDEAKACSIWERLFARWKPDRVKALVYFWILGRAAHELHYETYARNWGWEAIPGGRILQILRDQDPASAL